MLRAHTLAAGEGHLLHVEEFGSDGGIPALVLHGGPGSGCSPLLRRYFDPARYRIICPDQRGAGCSRPHGAILHNTTAHLLEDLRLLRHHLGLQRWLVVGGSWGASLAIAHAAAEPTAVDALLLRASFLARRGDIDWFFQGAATQKVQAWQEFAMAAPLPAQAALLVWLHRQLNEAAEADQGRAALAWWHWEQALAGTTATAAPPTADALRTLVGRYCVQSHYMVHDCWLTAPDLLQRCASLPAVPTLLLHANNDLICRPEGARLVHTQLPHSRLHWVDGAGHDAAHPAMVRAMVLALAHYATHRNFDAVLQA